MFKITLGVSCNIKNNEAGDPLSCYIELCRSRIEFCRLDIESTKCERLHT